MKLIFVGDPHITANVPSSRKETNEEYREVQMKKLKEIYENIAEKDDKIILLGDIFHSSALSMMSGTPKFYNDIIDLMNTRETYTIVGNHDMYFRNEDSQNVTILDNLLKTGVKHLDVLEVPTINEYVGEIVIRGVDYGHDFPFIGSNNDYNIIVTHSFFEDSFYGSTGNQNLTIEAINNHLGVYNAVVLGHDHAEYPILSIRNPITFDETTKIVRPGSLLRGTSHTCQINRIPKVAIFDCDTLNWEYREITNAAGKEVFKEKVILEKDIDINIENILNNINSYDKSIGIYNFIKSQESRGKEVFGNRYYDIINIIKQYLNTFGFINNGGK